MKAALILAAALSGCAQVPITVRDTPPAALLEECPVPEFRAETNIELAEWALALLQALRYCNNDKEALREWAEGMP